MFGSFNGNPSFTRCASSTTTTTRPRWHVGRTRSIARSKALTTAVVGYMASLWFVFKIYGAVKVD